MTVASTVRDVTYNGPGAGPFPVPYFVPAAADIVLTQTDQGAPAYVLQPAAYSVIGTGASVSVLLTTPLPSTSTLDIQRIVPYVQETTFTNQGAYMPSAIEAALDLLTMECQQLNAGVQYLAPQVAQLEASQGDVSALQGQVTALQNRATADEATQATLASQIGQQATQNNANSTAAQTISAQLAALQASVAQVNGSIATLNSQVAGQAANMAALTANLNALAAQVRVNSDAVSRAIQFPSGDAANPTLPAASTRAGNVLGFAAGTGALALFAQPGA